MQYNDPLYEKTVIYCKYCTNKLRVPTDKGKISVACPVCGKQFIYNPKSIIETLKQIGFSIAYGFPKNRSKKLIVFAVVLFVIVCLLFLIFGVNDRGRTKIRPGEMVHDDTKAYTLFI